MEKQILVSESYNKKYEDKYERGITLLGFQCGNLNGVPSIVTKCLGNGNTRS